MTVTFPTPASTGGVVVPQSTLKAWSDNEDALYAGGAARELRSLSTAAITSRTALTWSAMGVAEATAGDFSLAEIPAADILAAGFTKVQLRVRGVSLVGGTIVAGTPVNLRCYAAYRIRAQHGSPAAPSSSYVQIGATGSVVTNTASTYSAVDTGWFDSGLTLNSVVDFGIAFKPDSAGTDNTGSLAARLTYRARGA